MPPVVQSREYTKLVRTACVKTGYQAVRTMTYIHTEKFSTDVTTIGLATLAPISNYLSYNALFDRSKTCQEAYSTAQHNTACNIHLWGSLWHTWPQNFRSPNSTQIDFNYNPIVNVNVFYTVDLLCISYWRATSIGDRGAWKQSEKLVSLGCYWRIFLSLPAWSGFGEWNIWFGIGT